MRKKAKPIKVVINYLNYDKKVKMLEEQCHTIVKKKTFTRIKV